MSTTLRISIVCHAGSNHDLRYTLRSLMDACSRALADEALTSVSIALVDNGPKQSERRKIEELVQYCRSLAPSAINIVVVGDGRNIGFGAGHNLAIDSADSDYHLVLNPDVEMAPDALSTALQFMQNNSECGALAPAAVDQSGEHIYLCKRYPTLLDLFLRGFAPRWLQLKFEYRLAHYEMREIPKQAVFWGPPTISGCFMLLRSAVLKKIGGFNRDYFLYFEDFDLSLRLADVSQIAYVPDVKIMHSGGNAAGKGVHHVWLFVRAAITFFNRHGWKLY